MAIVAPMIPPGRHGGRRRLVNVREVLNGIFYVLWTGCQWKALAKDLPPKSTVHDYLELWNWDGTLERIHHALCVAQREEEGREASPTVAIIDSQTAKGAQKGGLGLILRATTRARVRLEGACHLWRKIPSRQLSIDLEADERFGWVTGRAEAS
jgi:transposase